MPAYNTGDNVKQYVAEISIFSSNSKLVLSVSAKRVMVKFSPPHTPGTQSLLNWKVMGTIIPEKAKKLKFELIKYRLNISRGKDDLRKMGLIQMPVTRTMGNFG